MNEQLNLDSFFPYQLAKLQAMISDTIAEIYMGEFDLSKQEWRILAILANQTSLNAKDISTKANIEKMPTSRAIKKMFERGLLEKTCNKNDKRSLLLQLTDKGKKLYQQLEPIVKQREQELLSVLSNQEISTINNVFSKLEKQAYQILNQSN